LLFPQDWWPGVAYLGNDEITYIYHLQSQDLPIWFVTSLCMNFIDFEKAFDSILWKILKHYGIPQKIISIIQQLYDRFSCQVIHDGNLTEPFTVTTSVKQACILPPLLFLMVIDWVSKTAKNNLKAYNGYYKPDWKILTLQMIYVCYLIVTKICNTRPPVLRK
jgi:hypothetical protein